MLEYIKELRILVKLAQEWSAVFVMSCTH